MSLLGIVGNIKQQYVPFVLNPNSGLNKSYLTNAEFAKATGSMPPVSADSADSSNLAIDLPPGVPPELSAEVIEEL